MYKTVRQGDASLRYTILPQIDQFHINEMTPAPGSSKMSNSSTKHRITNKISTICDYMDFTSPKPRFLGLRILVLFICCFTLAYVLESTRSEDCRNQLSDINDEEFTMENNNANDHETEDDTKDSMVTTTSEFDFSKIFGGNREYADKMKTSNYGSTSREKGESSVIESKIVEKTLSKAQETPNIPFTTSTERPSTNSPGSIEVASTITEDSTGSQNTVINVRTNGFANILKKLKMLKMPRVTLKLRTNETIPQMYVKSGIASYKKGNITTSVLAQGLSLEGLIFKTPEGTIKPWREEWPFDDNSRVNRLQTAYLTMREGLWLILFLLLLTSLLMAIRLTLVARQLLRPLWPVWHRIERIEVKLKDNSSSNLVNVEFQQFVVKK